MTIAQRPLSLTVNGHAVGPIDVPEDMMMLDFLHEYLDLTGSRLGCGQGICHACTIILDDPAKGALEMRTCITGAPFLCGQNGAHDRRSRRAGCERQCRAAVCRAAGLHRALRLPMRVLHARFRHRHDRADGADAESARRAGRCGTSDRGCSGSAYMPLHRLCPLLPSRARGYPEHPGLVTG